MSLKLSLDLISHADWSIHKNQRVVNNSVLNRTNCHLLSGLFLPSVDKANHARFFACELHSESHTFSVASGGKSHLQTFRLISKVKRNV